MMPFEQMHHFVDQHVFQARHWLLDQFQVQPDAPRRDVAASPARLHPPDPDLGNRLSKPRLPFGEQRRKLRPQLATVPALQHDLALGTVVTGALAAPSTPANEPHLRRAIAYLHVESVTAPLKIVALTRHDLSLGLAILPRELLLLTANPPKARNYRQPHGLIVNAARRRHANPARGGYTPT